MPLVTDFGSCLVHASRIASARETSPYPGSCFSMPVVSRLARETRKSECYSSRESSNGWPIMVVHKPVITKTVKFSIVKLSEIH